jgi:hypothetical protein
LKKDCRYVYDRWSKAEFPSLVCFDHDLDHEQNHPTMFDGLLKPAGAVFFVLDPYWSGRYTTLLSRK